MTLDRRTGLSQSLEPLGEALDEPVRARPADRSVPTSAARRAGWLLANMAAVDWVLAIYLTTLSVLFALGQGTGRDAALRLLVADVSLFAIGVGVTRGGVLRSGTLVHSLAYRGTLLVSLVCAYVHLRYIIPAITLRELDADIYAFDLRVFGFEPAVVMDRWVSPLTTEWFCFFYFLYFLLLVAHIFPLMFGARSATRFSQFVLGIALVYCTGQLLYIAVPGFGPFQALAPSFKNELKGWLFYDLAYGTVAAAGAQRDIFPSLHTAAPVFLTIFAYQNRANRLWRRLWPWMTFITSQIVLATMFLRWHYVVDVVAGFALGTLAALTSRVVTRWEARARGRRGLDPVFVRLPWA